MEFFDIIFHIYINSRGLPKNILSDKKSDFEARLEALEKEVYKIYNSENKENKNKLKVDTLKFEIIFPLRIV